MQHTKLKRPSSTDCTSRKKAEAEIKINVVRVNRVLSCSSLSQVSLCDGLVQTVVAVSKSRVVTSTHSAPGSALLVFTLSENGR